MPIALRAISNLIQAILKLHPDHQSKPQTTGYQRQCHKSPELNAILRLCPLPGRVLTLVASPLRRLPLKTRGEAGKI